MFLDLSFVAKISNIVFISTLCSSLIWIPLHIALVFVPVKGQYPNNEFISFWIWVFTDLICVIGIIIRKIEKQFAETKLFIILKVFTIVIIILDAFALVSHIILIQIAPVVWTVIQFFILSFILFIIRKNDEEGKFNNSFIEFEDTSYTDNIRYPCGIMTVLWICLGFLIFVMPAFTIQMCICTVESLHYVPPGNLYHIVSSSGKNTGKVKVHLYCKGDYSNHTFIIENGAGTSSIEAMNLQDALSHDNRVCIYDRAGTGYSSDDIQPYNDEFRKANTLYNLIQESGETEPFIIIGHSLGVEFGQLFAYKYPDLVKGLVIVDGYQDPFRLAMKEVNKWSEQETMSEIAKSQNIMRINELLAPLGIFRLTTESDKKFTPTKYAGARTSFLVNNKYWVNRYLFYGKGHDNSDLLTKLGKEAKESGKKYGQANVTLTEIMWPALKHDDIKVLVLPAGYTVNPDCERLHLSGEECQIALEKGRIFLNQEELYKSTLPTRPENGKLIICQGCEHSMLWENATFIAKEILDFMI